MQISSSDLINLPVYTQLGAHLGRIAAIDIDIETHAITHYHVRTGLIRGLWHQHLLIHPTQVISINAQKMVVDDTVGKKNTEPLQKTRLAPTLAK